MPDLKTVSIKGKQYVTVQERLKYFRETFAGYSLESELIAVNEKTALIRAVIRNDKGIIVATGTAFERSDNPSSLVNKTSHVENAETSAWGRALGNFGIGIDSSVASADEVALAVFNQENAPARKVDPEIKAILGGTEPASQEQIEKIAKLTADLGKDIAREVCEPFKINGRPNAKQAGACITALEARLTKELDAIASAESK